MRFVSVDAVIGRAFRSPGILVVRAVCHKLFYSYGDLLRHQWRIVRNMQVVAEQQLQCMFARLKAQLG